MLKMLAPRFNSINEAIYYKLYKDKEADNVRAAFLPFNQTMKVTARCIEEALSIARVVYAYNLNRDASIITEAMLNSFQEGDWQINFLECAQNCADRAKEAVVTLRSRVLPMLPSLSLALSNYIESYNTRYGPQDHQPSLRKLFKDFLGPAEIPAQWTLEGVRSLSVDFDQGVLLLRRLPACIDNLELHFRTLLRLNLKDISTLGYSSRDDFRRLYKDFIFCYTKLHDSTREWCIVATTFGKGVEAERFSSD
ncbi:hypothetical protein FRC14_006767 [Serendipita sp. 396]|nr:hypothetical protein FRC14_006767 [Serendipita sp. 396]KAG8817437.1 hypothetical protein FRC18_000508 [Serendipita sp. 400]KAG8827801.1 hypothetical protein FRC19_000306 [Serendipita sp. 401]KAG8870743.1 hypothetical protein FRC20_011381 [Serendipita sp. 405]KAG9057995.1 hypothetical protein FS842_002331 [Serendipita sp. 407]